MEDVIAVSDDNEGLFISKSTPTSSSIKALTTQQMLAIAIPGFGMAPSGVNLFTVQNKNLNIAEVTS